MVECKDPHRANVETAKDAHSLSPLPMDAYSPGMAWEGFGEHSSSDLCAHIATSTAHRQYLEDKCSSPFHRYDAVHDPYHAMCFTAMSQKA